MQVAYIAFWIHSSLSIISSLVIYVKEATHMYKMMYKNFFKSKNQTSWWPWRWNYFVWRAFWIGCNSYRLNLGNLQVFNLHIYTFFSNLTWKLYQKKIRKNKIYYYKYYLSGWYKSFKTNIVTCVQCSNFCA
jgi:hypothetical protein